VVGDDNFWKGIRNYYATYRDKNCSTDDFRSVMEDVSGMDLKWFFEQWLKRPGSPLIEATWAYDPATKRVQVKMTQKQAGEAYRLAVDAGVRTQSGLKVERLAFSSKDQSFDVAADAEPIEVVLDPNTWLLAEMNVQRR